MVSPAGTVKVLDFGIARRVSSDSRPSLASTAPGTVGTTGYMAPEVVLEQPFGPAADVFSLGVVFYEALAGFHPFLRPSFFETCERILSQHPEPLQRFSETPAVLSAIVNGMLVKDPHARPSNAQEIAKELATVTPVKMSLPLQTPSGSRTQDPSIVASRMAEYTLVRARRRRGRFLRWGAAVAVLVASLAGLFSTNVPRRVMRWASARVGAVRTQQLAVLPFTAPDGDVSAQAFSAGLTEAVADRLGGLSNGAVQVVALNDIRSQKVDSVQKARQQFGVDLVLTGSLRQSDNLSRVTYSLLDASTQRAVTGDTITVPAGDPFVIEDQVMASLGRALQLEDAGQASKAHGTVDSAAYLAYLRGLGYLQQYNDPEKLGAAVAAFQSAKEHDPGYALAFAGLGRTYWHMYEEKRDASQIESARLACMRALELDKNLPAGHSCLANIYSGTGRYDDAVREFNDALARNPSDDDSVRGLAQAYERAGKFADAETTYKAAIKLRPNYWANYNWLGTFYLRRGRYDESAQMFQRVIALAPENYRGFNNLGGVYIMQGKYAPAITQLERSVALRPHPTAYANLGTSYFFSRRYADAVRSYTEAVRLNDRDFSIWGNLADAQYWAPGLRNDSVETFRRAITGAEAALKVDASNLTALLGLAHFYAMIGEKQPALEYLRRAEALKPGGPDLPREAAIVAMQAGDRQGALTQLEKCFAAGAAPSYIAAWPNFDPLAGDPRFQQLMKSAENLQSKK